jgi:hypothetical protein
MKECIIPPHGHKRHNMAKVFAELYDYDDATAETKQQGMPVLMVFLDFAIPGRVSGTREPWEFAKM